MAERNIQLSISLLRIFLLSLPVQLRQVLCEQTSIFGDGAECLFPTVSSNWCKAHDHLDIFYGNGLDRIGNGERYSFII